MDQLLDTAVRRCEPKLLTWKFDRIEKNKLQSLNGSSNTLTLERQYDTVTQHKLTEISLKLLHKNVTITAVLQLDAAAISGTCRVESRPVGLGNKLINLLTFSPKKR